MKQHEPKDLVFNRVAKHWCSLSKILVATCLASYLVCCPVVPVVGQGFQSPQSLQKQAGMPVLSRKASAKPSEAERIIRHDLSNNWGLAPNLVDQLAHYPSAEVAFICGPQLKAGSSLNPFPWFDNTALKMGIHYGEEAPRVAPFGPMFLAKNVWRNIISGRVSVAARATTVTGKGTRFTRDFDLEGPEPGYSGHFRIRDASGIERIVKVRSVDSDTSLTLAAPWPFASVSDTVADTFYHELNFGKNTDHYYLANYYDTALVQYINYYRTGDSRFLQYARKTADALWHSQFIDDGTVVQGHDDHLPPRSMAFAGLMLRALDGRPEMWDYLEREVRATFDDWVYRRKDDAKLYYDVREDGYAQLYAVMMAKVLPDTYALYPNGTSKPKTGTATDGDAKRKTYLSQTEDAAVNFFGRLQRSDGSWRWNVEESSSNPAQQFRDVEQPFMVGLYLESLVLLHQLTPNQRIKASLVNQLTRSVRHLYLDAFESNHRVTDLPQYRWRSMVYYWGGGTVANPTQFSPPAPKTTANADPDPIRAARHLNSTLHHAFGYAYYVTGDESFKRMGDDVFEASYGDQVDGLHCLADSGKAKDYDMNYRASGRYLVWRLTHQQSGAPPARELILFQPATRRTPITTIQPTTALRSTTAPTSASTLVSSSLLLARQLSTDLTNQEQIEELVNQIENALRAVRSFNNGKKQNTPPDGVIEELQAALANARTALSMAGSESGGYESARLRLGWTAARLKRANERLKQK
jgi:hypothetical protein